MKNKKTLIAVIAAAVILLGVLLLLIFLPSGGTGEEGAATYDEGVKLSVSVDDKGVHQAVVGTDSKGNIENNSYGTLMDYVPADISQIHIENSKGTLDVLSTTPEGEATVYSVKGYENFDLQAGIPDLIASSAASITFERVAGYDNGEVDFGFDKPRSVVTVTYNDKTKAVITVGDDAPRAAGTYIKFGGGSEVYLIDAETAAPFDYGLTDLISLTINSAPDSSDNGQASSISISIDGEKIELVPYTGTKTSASYKMISPVECYVNEVESSLVEGGIRGLYAESVVMVNPSDSQLGSLELSSPNAALTAVYPDTTVKLLCSKPDSDGKVNLMVSGGNVVYSLAASSVAWSTTSYSALVSEYVLYPRLTSLSKMTVNAGGKAYNFDLSTRTSTTTDDNGEETTTTVTTVFLGDDEIQIGDFSSFYDEASLIELADADVENPSGSPALTITYTYSEDGSSDTVEFFAAGGNRYVAVLNGRTAGHARKADITRVTNDVAGLIK